MESQEIPRAICAEICRRNGIKAREIAKELNLSVSKVIKLLITGGVYSSDICRRINQLYDSGKSIPEIQKSLNISRASVQAYLPYKKCIYNAKELSLNAERIRRYRQRKRAKVSVTVPDSSRCS